MGLLDTWQEWKNRYSQNKEDRESLQIAGGRPGLRIGMRGYQAPDNAYTGLMPDTKNRLGQITQKGTYDQAPKGPAKDRLGRPYPKDAQGNLITPGTRATALAKKQTPDAPTNTVYKDDIMRGGAGTKQGEDPSWWQGLANKFNSKFNMADAVASWKEKGGFEGLMANPAFTMGLAFMQAGAEGKTLGSGALDNVMKAGGISQHYKQIIEDRAGDPVTEVTTGQMDSIKGVLGSVGISGPILRKMKPGNQAESYEQAVEDIAFKVQKKVNDMKKAAKKSGRKIEVGTRLYKKIVDDMIASKEINKVGGFNLFGYNIWDATLEAKAQGGPVQAGKPYIVGEQGPEVIIPNASGNVLSNDNSQIFAMLLAANPQLQQVSRTRSEKILRNKFPEYFE